MIRKVALVGGALALALGSAVQSQAATAISSSICVAALADADVDDGLTTQSSFALSQGATLNPLDWSLSVTDIAYAPTGAQGVLNAWSSVRAEWASADAGTVDWRDMGWRFSTYTGAAARLNTNYSGNPVWQYTFLAAGNGTFTLDYDVVGSGDTFGLWGAIIDWSGPEGGLDVSNAGNPAANGVFSRSITAGQTYTVGLENWANIYIPSGAGSAGSMNGTFHWSIAESSVPGPAAALPFLVGALAAFRRRRR